MEIITNRLTIRPIKEEDIMDFYEIYKNENTCRFLLHEPWTLLSLEEEFHKKLTANFLTQDTAISLACEMNSIVIGNISLWYTDMKETVEIGFAFNYEYIGKGYATESVRSVIEYMFHTLKIHRIQANLDARNLSSAKLCERVGMRREAHFVQDYWNKGEWTDSFVYGMLLSDLGER